MDTENPKRAVRTSRGLKLARPSSAIAVEDRAEGLATPTDQPTAWLRDIDRWFADCVAPYERQYLWLAKRMTRSDEVARDLVHDAYASIFSGGQWQTLSHPRAYVMRTIFTLGLKRIRRAKVVPMHGLPDFETLEFAAQSLDGYQTLSICEEVRLGLDAINALPATTRQVIVMRRLDGLAIKEIAARLGLSVKGVDYHIARGALLFTQAIEAAHLRDPRPVMRTKPIQGAK